MTSWHQINSTAKGWKLFLQDQKQDNGAHSCRFYQHGTGPCWYMAQGIAGHILCRKVVYNGRTWVGTQNVDNFSHSLNHFPLSHGWDPTSTRLFPLLELIGAHTARYRSGLPRATQVLGAVNWRCTEVSPILSQDLKEVYSQGKGV